MLFFSSQMKVIELHQKLNETHTQCKPHIRILHHRIGRMVHTNLRNVNRTRHSVFQSQPFVQFV